jgi:hypothetical protein
MVRQEIVDRVDYPQESIIALPDIDRGTPRGAQSIFGKSDSAGAASAAVGVTAPR